MGIKIFHVRPQKVFVIRITDSGHLTQFQANDDADQPLMADWLMFMFMLNSWKNKLYAEWMYIA